MRALWREPRPVPTPPRTWRDYVLAAVFGALGLIEGATRPDLPGGWVAVLLVFLLAPTLLFRRSHPLLMVAVSFAVTGVAPLFTGGVPPEATSLVFLVLLPYSLVRWGSGREIVLGVVVMAAKIALSIGLDQLSPADGLAGAAVTFAVAALGSALRYRAGARARQFDQIRLLERERLARDLHDTIAHHVSAMAIRAQVGLADPAAATDALRLIEDEAKQALTEMRAMVRVLRSDDEPAPRLADLSRLTDGRPPVDLGVSGDLDAVAPAVGAAVFRLAQEAITNARRHARHATHISVRVSADDQDVHLRVSDDGEPAAPARPGGFGLAGMRERAGLLGGVLSAGPDPVRGWTVTATLPRTGPAG